MKLSEMRRLLEAEGIRLTKSLGQNFLHDGNQLTRIVEAARLAPSDKVIEIGPGLGPLTERLVTKAGEVLAIELDLRLVALLKRRLGGCPNLKLIHADALEYFRRAKPDWSEWKLVANLPYSVASPILVELAETARGPLTMVVTLQLEVAQRLTARSGDDAYGLLSLLVQRRYEPGEMFQIPATCFFPEPQIASGCVTLQRRGTPLLSPEEEPAFEQIVRRGFSQRRKMMFKLLKGGWPAERLEAAYSETGLSLKTRAEEVSLEDFARLARRLGGEA